MTKACPNCGNTADALYCPVCRAKGDLKQLETIGQLTARLERMRRKAVVIKAAIAKLQEAECSKAT